MKSVLIFGAICIATLFCGAAFGQEIITSPPVTNWGTWGPLESCPEGTLAQGFQLLTEPWKGPLIDDTTGNGIRLFCGNPADPDTPTVTSSLGSWGKWGSVFSCGEGGYIYGFQLRVEANGIDDETATNNARFFCTNLPEGEFLEGDGDAFGRWTEERKCARSEALCAIQTQVQKDQGILCEYLKIEITMSQFN